MDCQDVPLDRPGQAGSPAPGRQRLVYVAVHTGGAMTRLRLFGTRTGGRTAVAFSSLQKLQDLLGEQQAWTRLGIDALPSLTGPLDQVGAVIDPVLVAASPAVGKQDCRRTVDLNGFPTGQVAPRAVAVGAA